ncbi:MAG: ABC transporter ATP-binding protein [Planctomycetes bacterium]|nr:ABC transporter ATP-binding protein [Planctomycetota bacterium]
MAQNLIKTQKLCKTFTTGSLQTPVLFDIDLEIARGEFVAVMGPSGCGKSTLMHIVGLMLTATSGSLSFDGSDIAQLTDADRARLRRDKIGFVFQRFNLLPTVTAYQNLAVAQRIRGRNHGRRQINTALQAVQMTDKALSKPHQLSIGQQQRIAIARAVCHQPDIVMADEPTGNLDSQNAQRILELFRNFHQKNNITIMMITHSPAAAEWADRIIHLDDGHLKST